MKKSILFFLSMGGMPLYGMHEDTPPVYEGVRAGSAAIDCAETCQRTAHVCLTLLTQQAQNEIDEECTKQQCACFVCLLASCICFGAP